MEKETVSGNPYQGQQHTGTPFESGVDSYTHPCQIWGTAFGGT
jgi:hypothetical protein